MGPLQQRLTDDMKTALKAGDKPRLAVLRLMIAALKDVQLKVARDDLTEAEETEVLQKAVKARRDAVAQARELGRQDVVDAESAEIEVIQGYLPQMLSGDALMAAVREVAAAVDYSGPRDTGAFMKEFMARYKGRAEGREVQAALKQL